MERKTLTRSDLAETVFEKVGLLRTESAKLIEMMLDEICFAIERGNVMLSSFGTFQVREKNERIGRNPRIGEVAPISQGRVVTLKASQILKDQVFQAHRTQGTKVEQGAITRRIQSGFLPLH
jgi:integration host factor subunit alpha